MNETITTIVGNVVDLPVRRVLDSGVSVTSFRVASTARRFDRVTNRWADGESLFLKVTCWRTLSDNTAACVVKGDPVIVTGRLFTRTYEVAESRRASYELEATAIGFDFNRGRGEFTRISSQRATTVDELGPDGLPTGSAIDAHIIGGAGNGAPQIATPEDGSLDDTDIGAAGDAFANASPVRPTGPTPHPTQNTPAEAAPRTNGATWGTTAPASAAGTTGATDSAATGSGAGGDAGAEGRGRGAAAGGSDRAPMGGAGQATEEGGARERAADGQGGGSEGAASGAGDHDSSGRAPSATRSSARRRGASPVPA
ncbi:single-stranded DNA-binding protein [Cryptosporangium sp. NPDC048952]|uniref:single-stranded DNA-binding protein n=1 Tax=Cryptosporangium sp. NPDC048952 TaxID=3363961 RepID=UPI0037191DD2